ncbi:MAG TPA: glycoside hydrolase family 5 protein [Xanthobacteraceae bacterium]|nr:glycoside hydrolase family 5 protein [Xanthobacteraceae bacterium]
MVRAFIAAAVVAASTVVMVSLAQPQSAVDPRNVLPLTGVNLAGAEFGDDNVPGAYERHYTYPKNSSIDYFAAKGMNIIRLPLLWERLQHRLEAELHEPEMERVDAVVKYAASKGMKTIIDVHNYAQYFKSTIGTAKTPRSALAHLWRQIAARYKNNEWVIFGLMNEPKGLSTETWLSAANMAIAQIRQTGAKNLIFVPGNGWSSARDWASSKYGTPNSIAMLKVADPGSNYVFEVHQYFDRDFTGTHADCQRPEIGPSLLNIFTHWARKHGKRGFLGEFGVGTSPACLELLDRVLQYLVANRDVWLGWTYWAAGSWWADDYFTNIEPVDGRDRPQMKILEKYLRNAGAR